jgi:hypothetical protein
LPPDQLTVKDVVVVFVYDKLVGCEGAVVTELLAEAVDPEAFTAVTTTVYGVPADKSVNVANLDATTLSE